MGKEQKEVAYINRIKVVLAEKHLTDKWLADKLGKGPGTVSKWCTNNMQPYLETLREIALCLDVNGFALAGKRIKKPLHYPSHKRVGKYNPYNMISETITKYVPSFRNTSRAKTFIALRMWLSGNIQRS